MTSTPHVRVRSDALEIDGRPTFLFGGEVQYFRVRDPGFDAAATHCLWADRLDQLRAAGCNVVSTYVPWDYHAPGPGRYDFAGARDLRRFLDIAAAKGLHLIVKPGPNILAEWPYGFTHYGAVPTWWKRANRSELCRDRRGEVYRWHPFLPALGQARNALPCLASERFRADTERWYERVLEEIRPLLGPGGPIVALQLDNETNLYWSDAYWIDHHPAALARWRARLQARYGTIEALSAAYHRRYPGFAAVRPPAKGRGPRAAHDDWFAHQHELVGRWLEDCRAMWARLGVNESDVLFLTNDTPQTFPARDFVLPNGRVKNRAGLHALDTYPRCIPIPRPAGVLYDRPFEPDLAAKLLDVYGDLHLGPSRFSFGVEIQGGHFPIPLGKRTFQPHEVTAASTTQTYLRLIAHGMKALVIYVIAGGLNLDGTAYDFQAAIRLDGSVHPRYEGVRAVGGLIARLGPELLESQAVESRVGLLANAEALGPGYGRLGEQRIFGDELRACFGWLASAGFTPRVLDVELATEADLGAVKTLVFPSSGRFSEAAAARLERFVEDGGTLVQALSAGRLERTLFPAQRVEAPGWLARLRRYGRIGGPVEALWSADGASGAVEVPSADLPRWRLPADAAPVLHAPEEAPLAIGYERRVGPRGGRAIFLGATPAHIYADAGFYDATTAAFEARELFLRRLLRPSGERRFFAFDAPREEAHARRVPSSGALLLFLFGAPGTTARCRLREPEALGLARERSYVVEDIFRGPAPARLATLTGTALREEGARVELGEWGTSVVRVSGA